MKKITNLRFKMRFMVVQAALFMVAIVVALSVGRHGGAWPIVAMALICACVIGWLFLSILFGE